MNEFEKRINALRIQFRAERISIQKDANRTIGHLNTAIGKVNSPEAREALRAEKARVYEATRQSMKYNRLCYRQQLDAIEDQYFRRRKQNPSKKQIRHMMDTLCGSVEASGEKTFSISFGDNRHAKITFD